MWNSKLWHKIDSYEIIFTKRPELEEDLRALQNWEREIQECKTCGIMGTKHKRVVFSNVRAYDSISEYYCKDHKPEYDEAIEDENGTRYFKTGQKKEITIKLRK